MKKLFLSCALFAVMLSACRENTEEYPKEVYKTKDGVFTVIVADSCEYVVKELVNRGYMAHKGNCKYCEERLKRILSH